MRKNKDGFWIKPYIPPEKLGTFSQKAESTGLDDDTVLLNLADLRNHNDYLYGVDGVISGFGLEAKPFSNIERGIVSTRRVPSLRCLSANVLAPYLYENFIVNLAELPWNPLGKYLWDILLDRFHRPPGSRLSGSTIETFYLAYKQELCSALCSLDLSSCGNFRAEHFSRLADAFGGTLTHLDLSCAHLDRACVTLLSKLDSLVLLDLSGTGLSDIALHEFCLPAVYGTGLLHLEVLLLANNPNLTQKALQWLSTFRSLQLAYLPFFTAGTDFCRALVDRRWSKEAIFEPNSDFAGARAEWRYPPSSKFIAGTVFPKNNLSRIGKRSSESDNYFYCFHKSSKAASLRDKLTLKNAKRKASVSDETYFELEKVQAQEALVEQERISKNPFRVSILKDSLKATSASMNRASLNNLKKASIGTLKSVEANLKNSAKENSSIKKQKRISNFFV